MTELCPPLVAGHLRDALTDFLVTTFALSDDDAQAGLRAFLTDPADGIFKGPYLRTSMPFAPAPARAEHALAWMPAGFQPYTHQAAAFERLDSSRPGGPQPTLVVTGTGSGKTEAFLIPVLDHVIRANAAGVTGMKALILYPMNALADDQAGRLARLITAEPALGGVRAGLYTGDDATGSGTRVTDSGLIGDRRIIRDDPPDILLTNYKMLDQLLLRGGDQHLWEASADSLQYLVLDEFHTYDGAQGTDVAMLLRRLAWALDARRARPVGDGPHPLRPVVPIGTSATLGADDGADSDRAMRDFARQVFGEDFDEDSVVRERRLDHEEWAEGAAAGLDRMRVRPVTVNSVTAARLADEVRDLPLADRCRRLLAGMYEYTDPKAQDRRYRYTDEQQLLLAEAHPFVRAYLKATARATAVRDLAETLLPGAPDSLADRSEFILDLHAALAHLRTVLGRVAPSTETHLWIRELTRIDREAADVPRFRWADDGAPEQAAPAFPAVYCRRCGRSGWGVLLATTGTALAAPDKDKTIRGSHARREGRFRALISAPREGALDAAEDGRPPGLAWFDPGNRAFTAAPGADDAADPDSRPLPVLALTGPDADARSAKDQCPSCGADDAIRFQGSAIATLLSVSLSTLFGERDLDQAEKKALVFTDSVQDAAHRAGFVTARSRALALRTMLRSGLSEQPCGLDRLVDAVIAAAGDDPGARHRLLPPSMADNEKFRPYWAGAPSAVPPGLADTVRKRLLLDASLEFGLVSRYGRTLEQTGTAWAQVDAGPAASIAALARRVLTGSSQQQLNGALVGLDEATCVRWVRGVLERMRMQGAIDHEWFGRFMERDGAPYEIWGGRRPKDAMPAFTPWRSTPAFPRLGRPGPRSLLDPVTVPQSWYARWTARVLGVDAGHAGALMRALFGALEEEGVVVGRAIAGGGAGDRALAVPARRIAVAAAPDDRGDRVMMLRCDVCRTRHSAGPDSVRELAGGPCLVGRCPGRLSAEPAGPGNFYRRMYTGGRMERVVAKEHTSLVEASLRRQYESGFKNGSADPGAPNVLVATPTLEMGIDIGDLSAVFLASLPRSVASYVQRVGRAGRANGNALDVALVTGRGEHLPRLNDPASLINGAVRPPATYLNAVEIVRRQFIAALADARARETGTSPSRADETMTLAPGGLLADIVERAEADPDRLVDRFAAGFDGILDDGLVDELRAWARPDGGPATSGLARYVERAVDRWDAELDDLDRRRADIDEALPHLHALAAGASEGGDEQSAVREAEAARRYLGRQLAERRQAYWIQPLELHGLLPNYTLIDDQVELDVQISWFDEDAHEVRNEPYTYTRGSARALREFAPGATFYVDGRRIQVDSVDLGNQGQHLHTWALCPECGYREDVTGGRAQPARCPRCAGTGIADIGQQYQVVELSRASAQVSRDGSRIDDTDEERARAGFTVVPMADIDPRHVTERWYAQDVGLGVAYAQRLDLAWLNLGPRRPGPTRRIGGHRVEAPLFRVCESCGHLDQDPNSNSAREHHPWCRHRNDLDEHARQIVLSRSLTTQGLLVTLPWQTAAGDLYAIPSLRAALRLGMQRAFGGSPDHLGVASVNASAGPGRPVTDGLLIHDLVPGGTGYLADVARPDKLWQILTQAYLAVRDCPCRDEGRLACHRCLLPFADFQDLDLVSRTSAERSLRELLGGEAETGSQPGWRITDQPPHIDRDDESFLEKRFRRAFTRMVEAAGGVCHEQVTGRGNIITAGFGPLTWRLEPQVNVLDSRPDFVLRGGGGPDLAIFTDGFAFHAAADANRLADDAAKRQGLREAGTPVLAVTMDDINAFEQPPDERTAAEGPFWFDERVMDGAKNLPPFTFGQGTQQAVLDGPFGILRHWMTAPGEAQNDLEAFGSAAPMCLFTRGEPCAVGDDAAMPRVARELLVGAQSQGSFRGADPDAPRPAAAPPVAGRSQGSFRGADPDAARPPRDPDGVRSQGPNGARPPGPVGGAETRRPAGEAAHGSAGGAEAQGTAPDAWWWRDGPLGVLVRATGDRQVRIGAVLVLDDGPEVLEQPEFKDAWQRWLGFSNALALRGPTHPTWIATAGSLAATGAGAAPAQAVAAQGAADAALAPEWLDIQQELGAEAGFSPEFFGRLAGAGLPVPEVGEELGPGIPVDLSWPKQRVAVMVEPGEQDVGDLAAEGWRLLPADAAQILKAMGEHHG